jgi:hypothetical protein
VSDFGFGREAGNFLSTTPIFERGAQAGGPRRSALIKIIHDAASDKVRYADEFGLTPVARTRIAKGIDPTTDKFHGLLAGPNNIGDK